MVNNTTQAQWLCMSLLRHRMTSICAHSHTMPIASRGFIEVIAPFGGADGISVPISWGSPPIIR